jgi:cytochrome b
MTREVRIALWILAALLLPVIVTPALGFYPPMILLYYGWPLVLLAMAWGVLDAAYHRDSVWREADQNKVVWVIRAVHPTRRHDGVLHPRAPGAAGGRKPDSAELGGVGPRRGLSPPHAASR